MRQDRAQERYTGEVRLVGFSYTTASLVLHKIWLTHSTRLFVCYILLSYSLSFKFLGSYIFYIDISCISQLQIADREPRAGRQAAFSGVLRSRLPSELRYKMDAQVKYTYEKSRFSIKNIKILIIFCIFFTKKNRK